MKLLLHLIYILFGLYAVGSSVSEEELDEQRFFWIPDSKGVYHFVDVLADPPNTRDFKPEEEIVYLVYTRKNPNEGQVLRKRDNSSINASNIDLSKPVKITIHGWDADYTSGTNWKIREAYLNFDDVNVITVDWSAGAKVGYLEAVKNTQKGGPEVADFIDWLNELGVPFEKIHVFGHSLGGQMVGIVGRSCTRGTIEHITGLDPAHPSWGINSPRIRKTDAKYVEIIHTNSGILGMIDAAGHNDFYPSGGKNMPGCDGNVQCSHSRSTDYIAASINNREFMGTECHSVTDALAGLSNCTGSVKLHMGGVSTKPELGIFALNTNPSPPFSQGFYFQGL